MSALPDTGITVGFTPDSEDEPAHFFIADEEKQVCCVPISGFDALNPDELPRMAAFLWGKLTGKTEIDTELAQGIAIAWLHCFNCYANELPAVTPLFPPVTLH